MPNRLEPAVLQRFAEIAAQVPLTDVPRHFAGIRHSPFTLEYLSAVLKFCPQGGRSLDVHSGSGYAAIWLSLRGVEASGIDPSPVMVERARQVNDILGGGAHFSVGNAAQVLSHFRSIAASFAGPEGLERVDVIHHQGLMEHFHRPELQAALAQQVLCAHWVVFSVPSIYYPNESVSDDERLLPLEEWQRLLEPFQVEELRLYGDPQHGQREHLLAVLRGQEAIPELLALMEPGENSYPDGISAIVHTRNEERHIGDCIRSLQGWTDEIIVCDMESSDATEEIARSLGAEVIHHPLISNFDRARNVSSMHARYRWVFFLDADERVPPRLGPALRQVIASQAAGEGQPFCGMLIPFRHHFAGHWMQCLYPGYTAPRLLRNGKFTFNARLHAGAQVDGAITRFPADEAELALVHYSYDSLSHYLKKLDRYTDGEAASMDRDGQAFHWQNAVRHFLSEFGSYYDAGAPCDGAHGFIYSFLSGFYRFEQHAKLYELRFRRNQLQEFERQVPQSLEEMLEFALRVVREKPLPRPTAINVVPQLPEPAASAPIKEATEGGEPAIARPERTPLVWCGPLLDPSGYGEECRHFLFGLDAIGYPVAAQILPWSHDVVDMPPDEQKRLQELVNRPVAAGFVQVVQNLGPGLGRHPEAGIAIGRTMFETDRLPTDWVRACNRMDYVWVPSEFNRQTFTAAGVAPEKLAVIPGCLDARTFRAFQPGEPVELDGLPEGDRRVLQELRQGSEGATAFLTVFDWTRHKGWDVLLRGFVEAFAGREDVRLWLKVWSTNGYTIPQLQDQAQEFAACELGHDLKADGRIRFIPERLSRGGLLALYRLADSFVLPTRGEGWGRPFMEAMACGKPTIGTNWSANTAFMNEGNSYLLGYEVVDVPEEGWRELSSYRGHRWAEPDVSDLKAALLQVADDPVAAQAKGLVAREEVLTRFDRPVVARLIEAEVKRVIELRDGEAKAKARRDSKAEAGERTATASKSPLVLPKRKPQSAPLSLRWEGAQFNWHSLGLVNRELCQAMLQESRAEGKGGEIELSLIPNEPPQFGLDQEPLLGDLASRCFASLSRPADVHVRHFFPPRFDRPAEGAFALMQPWEYGYLPTAWIESVQTQVDEVWCYSEFVRQVYLNSGVRPELLQVVPLGVDTEVFTPQAPLYSFSTEPGAKALAGASGGKAGGKARERPFVFLFVGGTLQRKGIDILLEAYKRAFTRLDEVCLVIKDTGTKTVYSIGNDQAAILQRIEANDGPPIVYTDADLGAHQLAGLYTASDCLVQPYRGEGFCLPALEAMACGIPVIVPEGGPTDDFVDETVGWRLRAEHKPFSVGSNGKGRIGDWECAGPTWMLEVDPDDLARLMRRVVNHREEVEKRGAAARVRAVEGWSWRHSAQIVLQRCEVLRGRRKTASSRGAVPATPDGSLLWVPPAARRPAVATLKPAKAGSARPAGGAASSQNATGAGGKRREPTISLVMIVKNEERVLGACLESAKPWFDEMIVVDTGSTDRSVAIAEEHGARLYHFPWVDDFSAARNVSLEHATGDWVFWMDADDTLPPECGARLKEAALTAEERTTGFIVKVHIPAAPGETGFTIVDHVKLFRNDKRLRFEGRIHEQILEPIHRIGGSIERSESYVVHSGYDYSPDGQKHKRQRDLTILEKDLAERPDHPFVLFNIGMTAFHMKEFPKAESTLQQCLAVSKPNESTVRKVYAMLTGCRLEQGDVPGALVWLEKGLAAFPRDPELLFRAGIVYREAGQLPRARDAYITLLTAREVGHVDSLDVTMTGFKAHHNLALIYQDMGDATGAERHFRAAVEDSPAFVPSWAGLAETYRRCNRPQDAQAAEAEIKRLLETKPPEL